MHKVKCRYCGITFDRDKVPCVKVDARRYAHPECHANADAELKQEDKDKKDLYDYIKELFKIEKIPPTIPKQIDTFVADPYNFTYSGIHKSLKYYYEIKGHPVKNPSDGIGIVPYCYSKARTYYLSVWLAQQNNKEQRAIDYIPEVKEYTIKSPQRNVNKRKLFTFLEEEFDGE